jgi:hypothetical protein
MYPNPSILNGCQAELYKQFIKVNLNSELIINLTELQLASHLLHVGFLHGLFSDPEDGEMFLQNVGWLSMDYRVIYHIQQKFSSHFRLCSVLLLLKMSEKKPSSLSASSTPKGGGQELCLM